MKKDMSKTDLDDFEDLEIEDQSLLDPSKDKPGRGEEDEEEIQCLDAFQLSNSELMAEMERRGLHAKGYGSSAAGRRGAID